MDPTHERALDDCLDRLLNGESVEDCRAEVSEEEMITLVELAAFAHRLAEIPGPVPSPAAIDAGRERMLARLREKTRTAAPVPVHTHSNGHKRGFTLDDLIRGRFPLFQAAAAFLLIIVLSSGFAISASAQSLPGEALYPVKIAWEGVQVSLADNPTSQQQLKAQFQTERQVEIKQIVHERRSAETTYQDILKNKEPDRWQIGLLWVAIRPDTQISGDPQVGDVLSVTVQVQPDGSMVARTIQVVESPTVEASPTTRIPLSQTKQVYVNSSKTPPGRSPSSGSAPQPGKNNPPVAPLPSPTPEPTLPIVELPTNPPPSTDTPAPVASATSTTTSTATAIPPTSTGTATQTATPTVTATQTATPTVTATPSATSTTQPSGTPTTPPVDTPTALPSETSTPLPTETPTPAPTSTAADTSTPTALPTETNTPLPTATDTQAPTDTPAPSNTPVPPPTATDIPLPTISPPTATNIPIPTDTPLPAPTSSPTPIPPTPTNAPASSMLISILIRIFQPATPTVPPHS